MGIRERARSAAALNMVFGVFVATCLVAQMPSHAGLSKKKGLVTGPLPSFATVLPQANASWFYNWKPDDQATPAIAGVEYVPMFWDEAHVTAANIEAVKGNGSGVLLGFNRPDERGLADMSVEKALELWPQLMQTGLRLGSPSSSIGATRTGSWLDKFMTQADSLGYPVDFVCVHWYGIGSDPDVETGKLKTYLQAVHARYKKPIWLTEFALVDWRGPTVPDYNAQAAFLEQAIPMLQSLSFLERYAWFRLDPYALKNGQPGTLNLFDSSGVATALGRIYQELGESSTIVPEPRPPKSLVTKLTPPDYVYTTLQQGGRVYVDRDFVMTSVGHYKGMPFIRTANDDSALSTDNFLSFSLSRETDVYVGYSSAAQALPTWLSGWLDTGDTLLTTGKPLVLYRKTFPAGTVAFGGNAAAGAGNTGSMYIVLVDSTDAAGNRLPKVSLNSPTRGDVFSQGETIVIKADAADRDGEIVLVEFYHGTVKIGEVNSSPYSYTWESIPAGRYEVSARAVNTAGLSSKTGEVVFFVSPPSNQPPTIQWVTPTSDQVYTQGDTIHLEATATDADGGIRKVEFFYADGILGEVSRSPYRLAWANALPGTYLLTATATDTLGAATSTAAIEISVTPLTSSIRVLQRGRSQKSVGPRYDLNGKRTRDPRPSTLTIGVPDQGRKAGRP